MKKWITCILSVYILFSTAVPCSIFDNCEEREHTEQTSNKDHKKDCTDCPPFSLCSAMHGFAINSGTTIIDPMKVYVTVLYGEVYSFFKSEYYSNFFQPPRFS